MIATFILIGIILFLAVFISWFWWKKHSKREEGGFKAFLLWLRDLFDFVFGV